MHTEVKEQGTDQTSHYYRTLNENQSGWTRNSQWFLFCARRVKFRVEFVEKLKLTSVEECVKTKNETFLDTNCSWRKDIHEQLPNHFEPNTRQTSVAGIWLRQWRRRSWRDAWRTFSCGWRSRMFSWSWPSWKQTTRVSKVSSTELEAPTWTVRAFSTFWTFWNLED